MSQLSKKMAIEAAKPHRIAVYAHLTREDHFSVFEVQFETHDEQWNKLPPGEERECTRSDFVRISDITTVYCTPIDEDTITQNAVKSLDTTANNIRTEMLEQLSEIANRKKQLLALTYEAPVEVVPVQPPVAIEPEPQVEHTFYCNRINCNGECVGRPAEPILPPGTLETLQARRDGDFDDDIPF